MVKKLFLISIMTLTLFAGEIKWYRDTNKASQEAYKVLKPIFFVIQDEKGDFLKSIEKDKMIVNKINKYFIPLAVEANATGMIPHSLYKPAVPSLWFLFPDMTPMYRQEYFNGHTSVDMLPKVIDSVIDKFSQMLQNAKYAAMPYELHVDFPYYTSLQEAKKQAKKEKKPIFMLIGSMECKYCRALKKGALANKEILRILKNDYIVMVLDAKNGVPHQYKTPGIPAMWILDGQGNSLTKQPLVGNQRIQSLLQTLKEVKQKARK
jgi:uncharacterized protein YyaL (SSP411 family)